MTTWSGMRAKLEKEYLAECLRGHIQYFATSYSRCPDHEGRAAIMLDGKEIISGGYYNNWVKASEFPHDEKYEQRMKYELAKLLSVLPEDLKGTITKPYTVGKITETDGIETTVFLCKGKKKCIKGIDDERFQCYLNEFSALCDKYKCK